MNRIVLILSFLIAAVCWPTDEEIKELSKQLMNDSPQRLLKYTPGGPRVGAVPILSLGDQPLYGLGKHPMQGLYYGQNNSCATLVGDVPFCSSQIRNNPQNDSVPAFVIFALSPKHIQLGLQFANNHNLCVSVAGTGHDFMTRHSCQSGLGVLIRTVLMKNYELNLNNENRLGQPNIKFGAGTTFSEAHKISSENKYVVSSGYSPSVGIAGWVMGGGHGPLSPWLGLGVDQLLEISIIIANGSLVIANKQNNSDLFWALRGGGGSAFGIATDYTVKATPIPEKGFGSIMFSIYGDFCTTSLLLTLQHWEDLSLRLPAEVGSLQFTTAGKNPKGNSSCSLTGWNVFIWYTSTEGISQDVLTHWSSVGVNPISVEHYETWWDLARNSTLEYIVPFSHFMEYGVPSVLVSRETHKEGKLVNFIYNFASKCRYDSSKCGVKQQSYQSITGNVNSPQDPEVSISSELRTSIIHFVSGVVNVSYSQQGLSSLGSAAYFSESAMDMPQYESAYWGHNYPRLSEVKSKYDPEGVFDCYHCVKGK